MPDRGDTYYTARSRVKEGNYPSSKYSENTHDRESPMKNGAGCGRGKKRWGVATMYLWFVIAPIFIWILLFSMKPSFVSDTVNGQQIISQQRLLLWTLVFTVISWVVIYAVYYCKY